MIKRVIYILFFLTVLLGAEMKESYTLDDLISGADAFGRGGTYLAAENSSSYVFQNYSLLGKQERPRITLTAFKLISEINYLAAAYSQGNWGLGVMNIGDNGGYVRDERNNIIGGQIGYNKTTVYGAYGRQLSADFFTGARLKYHSVVFSEVDAFASGLALDIAAFYQADKRWLLSGELNNLLSTPLNWSTGFQEVQPLQMRLGTQFKFLGPDSRFAQFKQPVNLYADVRLEKIDSFWSGGVEYWPSEYVALRAGIKQTASSHPSTSAYPYEAYSRFTAGVGFNWRNIYIDYAYNPGDDLADNITHFFTLSYRFAEPPPEPEFSLAVEEVAPPPPPRKRMFLDLDKIITADMALIEDLGYLGIVEGYPGLIYGPELPMTRRELMMVLVRLLDRENRKPDKLIPVTRFFPDIASRDRKVAETAISYGLLSGYPDGLAHLEDPVRRDEAASAIARYYEIAGQELLTGSSYTDVSADHWGYKDINLAKQYSLTKDIAGQNFTPKEYLLRLEAAKILGRMQHVKSSRVGLQPLEGFTAKEWQELLQFPVQ